MDLCCRVLQCIARLGRPELEYMYWCLTLIRLKQNGTKNEMTLEKMLIIDILRCRRTRISISA